ncbi:MAG: ABC transporter ATP-binding protein [Pseudomonadota bacterium]
MIVFDNVTKYFPTKHGRKYILQDVSLTLRTGENVGVIGPNGAGKTTMMRLICGVDIPNAGRIDTSYFLSWPMGLAGGLQGAMSGRENAKFVCRILGEPEDQLAEKLAFIQDFAEIGSDFDLPVQNYSTGMRARLNFAISMGFKFDCYVVDELTAVGDQRFREKSAKFFKDKRDEACFIKVSHNLKELEEECDSALFIMGGKLYYFPNIREGIQSYKDVLTGNPPPCLDDHLVSKRERASGSGKSWLGSLASMNLKAPLFKRKTKDHVMKRRSEANKATSAPLPPPELRPSIPKPSKPPAAPTQLVRSPQVEEKPKLDRFAHCTDILERMLEVRKINPPG